MTRYDALILSLCAVWVAAVTVIAAGGSTALRALLTSAQTANWVGAFAATTAIIVGFNQSRRQMEHQAAEQRKGEQRASARKIRTCAMVVRATHNWIDGYRRKLRTVEDPQFFTEWSLSTGWVLQARPLIESLNVFDIDDPQAIDAILGAMGHFDHLVGSMAEFVEDGIRADIDFALDECDRWLTSIFITLHEIHAHYDPEWKGADTTPPLAGHSMEH